MNPRVRKVTALPEHRLLLEFTDGETGTYDCSPLLEFGVFAEFRDPVYFSRARVKGGTVGWPHGQDIDPDTLYMDSRREDVTGD